MADMTATRRMRSVAVAKYFMHIHIDQRKVDPLWHDIALMWRRCEWLQNSALNKYMCTYAHCTVHISKIKEFNDSVVYITLKTHIYEFGQVVQTSSAPSIYLLVECFLLFHYLNFGAESYFYNFYLMFVQPVKDTTCSMYTWILSVSRT